MFDWSKRAETERREKRGGEKSHIAIFSFFVPLTVAAPDLLDPKSATHNTKPRLSFSTKPITLTPREESEVREDQILKVVSLLNISWYYSTVGGTKLYVSSGGLLYVWGLIDQLMVLQVVATVMKWKTVSAIFFLVVLYLVMGAAVFRSLEQPHERWARYVLCLSASLTELLDLSCTS